MNQYDLSNEEILNNFEDVGRCPIRLWRLAVAHTSRNELHSGLVANTSSQQYNDEIYKDKL